MIKYSKIIIDGNNLYHKNWHTQKYLTTKLEDGTELITGGIYGFLQSLKKLERELLSPNGEIYILFDNHTSKDDIRKLIDPDYKANRDKRDPTFVKGLELLQLILLANKDNHFVVYRSNYEADDLVFPLLRSFTSTDRSVLISEDMDWSRSLADNVHWKNKKGVYNLESFEDFYGFVPGPKVTLYKAIRGDTSDNIPPSIPGIRKPVLLRLIEDFDNADDLAKNYRDVPYLGDIWKKKIEENRGRLRLNYQLVDFLPIADDEFDQYLYPCKLQPNTLRVLYKALGFKLSTDVRLQKAFPEKVTNEDFFSFSQIKRI